MRQLFRLTAGHGQPEVPPFDLDNRGKRSVVLDLRTPDGPGHDAAGSSPRPTCSSPTCAPTRSSASASGPRRCSRRTPRLVYASITGYGRTGPDADRPGYDVGRVLGPHRAWPARSRRTTSRPRTSAAGWATTSPP